MPGFSNAGSLLRRLAPLWIAAAATLLAASPHAAALLGVRGSGWLGTLELTILQRRQQARRLPASREIVIVTIERDTPRKLGIDPPVRPLPRSRHAELIRLMREAGVRAVLLDLLFSEPSRPDEDAALASALAEAGPMHLTLAADFDPLQSRADADAPTGWRYWFQRPVVAPHSGGRFVQVASAAAFDPSRVAQGAVLVRPDEAAAGGPIPHLALSVLLGRHGVPLDAVRWDPDREEVRAGAFRWSVGADGELLARWSRSVRHYEAYEYADFRERLMAEDPAHSSFRNRIVLIGDGIDDHHDTPAGRMKGVEFVAEMLNTLLSGRGAAAERWSLPANAGWSLLLAAAAAAAVSRLRARTALSGFGGALLAAAAAPQLALEAGAAIDTALPVLAVLGAGLAAALQANAGAGRFRPAYFRDRSAVEQATVVFVDLRDSTAIGERLGAATVALLQSELLQALSAAVTRSGGVVERTLGDGLMAVYRSPRPDEHARRAVQGVHDLLRAVAEVAQKWQRPGLRIHVTIGVETGTVAGRLITASHDEWSSFGPTVNEAARLQAACKRLGVSVLIGPDCALAVQGEELASVGEIELEGISGAVPVFTLRQQTGNRKERCDGTHMDSCDGPASGTGGAGAGALRTARRAGGPAEGVQPAGEEAGGAG